MNNKDKVREQLKNKKIWIGYDEYMHRRVQEILFEYGIVWGDGGYIVKYFGVPALFINKNLKLSCGGKIIAFEDHRRYDELKLDEFFKLIKQENITDIKIGDKVKVVKYVEGDALGRHDFNIGDEFVVKQLKRSPNEKIDTWVHSEYNKRISINSLVKVNNSDMKEEKSELAVYSQFPYLKKALVETLQEDGYEIDLDIDYDDAVLFFKFSNKSKHCNSCVGVAHDVNVYRLDVQWNESLAKVKELYNLYNQPTYEIGDRFWSEQMDCDFLLACVDYDRKINLISIERGSRLGDAIEVNDVHNINKEDFDKVCKGYKLEKL